ncbi:MAG TPA: metallophosphoesterase, partial [Vicinamibacteria bacterium]|nr:metallophosphoesterase [Vicinamibacteria bacterium]
MRKLSPGWLVFFLLSLTSSPTAATRLQYDWEEVPRIVAIGDVHGAYDNLVSVLKNAGLIDDKLDWVGGEAHLVQVGDVVDRGADSRRCLDLLMELEKKAERAGGQVHLLIGNHEAFNVTGITDHTTPEEFRSYLDLESEDIRERSFMAFFRQQIEAGGTRRRGSTGGARETFDEKYPPGYFGHREAFDRDGYYGRWILEHNVAVRLNGIVFSHGDWSVEISALGIEKVNENVRKE